MLNKILKSCQSGEVNKVTSLSKMLATLIFIILPFFAGYIGYEYGYDMGKIAGVKQSVSNNFTTYQPAQTPQNGSVTEGGIEESAKSETKNKIEEMMLFDNKITQSESELKMKIESMLSTSANNLEECKAWPMGVAICGGPAYYLPYSKSTTKDLSAIQVMSDQYAELQKQKNEKSGLMGICAMAIEPKLKLINNNCSF